MIGEESLEPGMSRARDGMSLAVWVGCAVLAGTLVALATAVAVLVGRGAFTPQAREAVGTGAAVSLILAALAGALADRFAGTLRRLRAEALARLRDPSAPVPVTGRTRSHAREVVHLARTLDALHLRVRMADEVAQQHRRTAERSSAGVAELLSGLVAAEEAARGQLSAELHDTVAQSLMLARALLVDPETGQIDPRTARACDLVTEAEEQVRAVMARFRPPALRDGDLAQAVAALRDDLDARYGLVVETHWPSVAAPMPLATAITVYRFFQEALLNVVKHADVDRAVATLEVDDHGITAAVRDEGPGFDPSSVRPTQGRHVGLGLLGERARLSGGRLRVDSAQGRGTTLTLVLPWPPGMTPRMVPAAPVQGAAAASLAPAPRGWQGGDPGRERRQAGAGAEQRQPGLEVPIQTVIAG